VAPFTLGTDAQAVDSVIAAMGDPSPSVRRLAAQLLADVDDARARSRLRDALDDQDPGVVALAAASLAGTSDDGSLAARLRALATDPDATVRAAAVDALSDAPAGIGVPIAATTTDDPAPAVRAAAIRALAGLDPEAAEPVAIAHLQDPSALVRRAAAGAAATIGAETIPELLDALSRPAARDAALDALAAWTSGIVAGRRCLATAWIAEATQDRDLADALPDEDDATALLRDALLARGRATGRTALRALSLTHDDGSSLRTAVENLDARDGAQAATALETLESSSAQTLVRPLIPLWDRSEVRRHDGATDVIERTTPTPTRSSRCAASWFNRTGDDTMAHVHATMPAMERICSSGSAALRG
jgi:HEAT repeat protein